MGREVIFVHVPKTGGISILPVCVHHKIGILGHDIRNRNYISLGKYKTINPDCFTFAFVRNPWDRLVSTFFYLKKGGDREEDREDAELYIPYDDFRSFVLEAFKTKRIFEQMHFRPQYTWLSDDKGLVIDSIGKFEDLQSDFSNYCRLFELPDYKLPHHNKTQHENYREYYDAETWGIVHDAYEKDIKLFGYDPEV